LAARPEENEPRILPPATGEQVPAARPNSLTTLAHAANGAGSSDAVDAEPTVIHEPAVQAELFAEIPAVEQSTPDAEQATHHG
jgi:hypothetical protein